MGYGEDDLSSFEKSRLGINSAHSVYLIRNSLGDVVSIKAVDPVGNRENVIDLRSPMHREGQASIVEAVRMVYGGMNKLPQNYIVVMDPAGQLSRGTLSASSGYSGRGPGGRDSGKVTGSVMGNSSSLESFSGKGRRRVSSDAYGPGESSKAYFGESPSGYGKGDSGRGEKSAGKGEKPGALKGPAKGAPEKENGAQGHFGPEAERSIEDLLKDLAFEEQKRAMNEALASRKGRRATVNYSDSFADELSEVWESSVF